MKWQGRTGLLVGLALVVAAGLVLPVKKNGTEVEVQVHESAEVVQEKERPDAVPVSRSARESVPGIKP